MTLDERIALVADFLMKFNPKLGMFDAISMAKEIIEALDE